MASEALAIRIPTAQASSDDLTGFGGRGYEPPAHGANDGSAASGLHPPRADGGSPGTPKVQALPGEKLEEFLKEDFIEKYLANMPGPLRKVIFEAFEFPEGGGGGGNRHSHPGGGCA